MSTEKQPSNQPPTNDELLLQAEQKLTWANNNYGKTHNDLSNTAALLSLAASALVIARSIAAQTEMMSEVYVPDLTPGADEKEGA